MNRAIIRLPLALAIAVALHAGCTTTSTGSTAKPGEAAVRQVVAEWIRAMQSKDTDAILVHYSESFTNATYPSKAAVRDAVEQARVMGMLDNVQGDLSAMSISKSDDSMMAGPVRLVGAFGERSLNVYFKDESGTLKIVTINDLAVAEPKAF